MIYTGNLNTAEKITFTDWSLPYREFSLVIPLWNEQKNINLLIESIEKAGLFTKGMKELILVNNGSTDNTAKLVNEVAASRSWIVPVHLEKNLNYGGGIYEGCRYVTTPVVCFIPGDLQVSPEDVLKVWNTFQNSPRQDSTLVQGVRTIRRDGWQTKFVSRIYTSIANLILGVRVQDVNGLPKMFSMKLLDLLPQERMKTFVFDIQLIATARVHGWSLVKQAVTFHARREGISSWSGKRIKVYKESFKSLLRLRKLRYAESQPLVRLR